MEKQIQEIRNCLSELRPETLAALKMRAAELYVGAMTIKDAFNESQKKRLIAAFQTLALDIGKTAMFGTPDKVKAKLETVIAKIFA
jgi:hypothetical protein